LERAVKTALPNPNAAIASALLADGRLLLAFNNAGENREDLSLAVSEDSATRGASCAGSKAIRAPPVRRLPNTRTRGSCRTGPARFTCSTPGAFAHQARAFQHGVAGGKALMSRATLSVFSAAVCSALRRVATLIPLRRLPAGARYAVMLAAPLRFIPFGDLPAAAYLRGITGDVSVTTLVLAGAACIARLTGKALIEPRDKQVLYQLLALAAAFLYPFALGGRNSIRTLSAMGRSGLSLFC